jgi:hypothetical protein
LGLLVPQHIKERLPQAQNRQAVATTSIEHLGLIVVNVCLITRLRLDASLFEPAPKPNPNVAIEYGYAVRQVTDELILLVQNTHYGSRLIIAPALRRCSANTLLCTHNSLM